MSQLFCYVSICTAFSYSVFCVEIVLCCFSEYRQRRNSVVYFNEVVTIANQSGIFENSEVIFSFFFARVDVGNLAQLQIGPVG
jgi:hypothetical protein